jgi:hypothetical protein
MFFRRPSIKRPNQVNQPANNEDKTCALCIARA